MLRTPLLALTLIACNASSASKLDSHPERNLVCERVAILSPKAECKPELSGAGDLSTHTARVTVASEDGKSKSTLVCGLNAGQLSMACGTLEVQAAKQQETPTAEFTPGSGKAVDGKAPALKAAKK